MDLEVQHEPARLPRAVLEAIAKYSATASWPAGFQLYQRGTPAEGLFVVVRGRIVLRCRVKAGRGFVPHIATRGDVFGSEGLAADSAAGVLLESKYSTDARADLESETLHLTGARFRAFLREQPQHAVALMAQISAQHGSLLERLRELATLSVEQRLLGALYRMSRNETFAGDDGRVQLAPGQYRLLCEMVGATRESVSLVLGRLASDGLAERDGAGFVISPAPELAARLVAHWRDGEVPLVRTSESAERPTA